MFKEIVSVINSHPPCKDGSARITRVPLKHFLINNVEDNAAFSGLKVLRFLYFPAVVMQVNFDHTQGYNARKVISRCTHRLYCKMDVTALYGIHLPHKKSMKYSGHWKLLCEFSK